MVIGTVALEKGLKTEFNKGMSSMIGGDVYSKLYAAIATELKSSSASEKYGWLGDVPIIKEWIGDKTAGDLADYDYTITNKDFYTAIAIDRNELKDDQMGIILPRVQMMVNRIKAHKGKLIANLLINGVTNLAYDGSAFFANRTAPNDNLLAGTGTTLAQVVADIASTRAAMMKFKSDTGEVLGLEMDTIACAPEMEYVIRQAVTSTTDPALTGNANSNPVSSWIKNVLVLPNATDANDWYGLATGFPVKPLIYQDREKPTPVLDDTQVKRNRKLIYSAEMRGNAGYGFFQMAAKVVNA